MVLANIFDFQVMSKSLGSNRPCLINVPSWAKKMIPREKLYAGQRACRCRENCTPVVFKLMLEENWCHALSTHLGEPLHDCWETGKSRACHELPSLVNLSQHMRNKVGKEQFEKLSDIPEWSTFDISEVLFDKFLLFFKLEAVTNKCKDGHGKDRGLGKTFEMDKVSGNGTETDSLKQKLAQKEKLMEKENNQLEKMKEEVRGLCFSSKYEKKPFFKKVLF